MDLHLQSVSPPSRTPTPSRSQPIRLQPATSAAPAELAPFRDITPVHRAKAGPFTFEQGGFLVAGQSEVEPDGRSRIRGTARFTQDRVKLEGDGRFILGYDGPETALIGEGEFRWQDGKGAPIFGRGSVAVRQDALGNAVIELKGTVRTRHQTIDIAGPASAEIDARANGSYVVRLKGRARLTTAQANVQGDLDLTYGEIEGEPMDAVHVFGHGQTVTPYATTDGEGRYLHRRAYSPRPSVLTVEGEGTYCHGGLSCHGRIHLRIVPLNGTEAVSGTVSGTATYRSDDVTADGTVEGQFCQNGEHHEFTGTLTGPAEARWDTVTTVGEGTMQLTLDGDRSRIVLRTGGDSQWQTAGTSLMWRQAIWTQDLEGTRRIRGEGSLRLSQTLWAGAIQGPAELAWNAGGRHLDMQGTGCGRIAGLVGWTGPVTATLDGESWRLTATSATVAEIGAATLPKGMPVLLESGPLPDGQRWWHYRMGDRMRRLEVSATGPDAGIIGRWHLHDPDHGFEMIRPLAPAETLDPQPEGEADAQDQPKPPKPQPSL